MEESTIVQGVPPPKPFEPTQAPVPASLPPAKRAGFVGIAIIAIAVWLLFSGGLESLSSTSSTIQTGATRYAATLSAGVPTAAVVSTPTVRIIIPTFQPGGSGGKIVVPVGGNPNVATEVPTAVASPTPVPTPADCVLTTWPNGSQSCSDGRIINSAMGVPGYCIVTPGTQVCQNGQPAGQVILQDPEIAADPTNTPWPAKVDDAIVKAGTTWSGWYKEDGTSCVTVHFADGHIQTNCGDPGVHYNAANLEFIARMIIDGKLPDTGKFPRG